MAEQADTNAPAIFPLSRPYPPEVIESARRRLRGLRYDENTILCAESFNTALWQRSVFQFLSASDLAERKAEWARRKSGVAPAS